LLKALEGTEIDALVLNPGPSLTYLTGLRFHLSERPVLAIFTPEKPTIVVLPELEKQKVVNLSFDNLSITYGEDPNTWVKAFTEGTRRVNIIGKKVGIETRRLRILEMQILNSASPNTEFVSADQTLNSLRMHKDDTEISAMRRAVDIAQNALNTTIDQVKIGMTEIELASELTLQLLHAGSTPQFPFFPIVSGGPNSANPHASPTNRALSPGDLLVIDWGASHEGYVSDITRTFAIQDVEDEFIKVAKIVAEANNAAFTIGGPGVQAGKLDHAARSVIDEAGYGKFFTHRTGHGLGMEGHEAPYIREGNDQLLQPGMTFTIEPGIYLPGRGGVRIEDDVLVTTEGLERLTNLPRELVQIG
jgi:Xaa-Pro dipeptidase